MSRNYMPSLGTCCACGAKGKVRNILTLDRKCPTPGRGWGCVVCALPADGATAVVCDKCFESKAPLKWACKGYPAADGRVPVQQLVGTHRHDASKHPEVKE